MYSRMDIATTTAYKGLDLVCVYFLLKWAVVKSILINQSVTDWTLQNPTSTLIIVNRPTNGVLYDHNCEIETK